jgi:hypothetical protein
MNTYTANVLETWGMATESQLIAGCEWYPLARNLALIVGHGDIRMGAGIIAALSPQKSWKINQRLAWQTLSGVVSGQVGDAVRKTERIMQGEDPDFVLPHGKKTWHFFHNIVEPANVKYVTIDRHAYRVASFEWDNHSAVIKASTYAAMVLAYQEAANILREFPSTVQAVTWLVAKDR